MKKGPAIGIGIGIIIVAIIAYSGWATMDENSLGEDQLELGDTDDLETTGEGKNFRITLEDGIGAGDLP